MYYLARDRHGLGRVTPYFGHAILSTHGFKNFEVPFWLTVYKLTASRHAKSLNQSRVDLGRFSYPSTVGERESFRKIEPSPHDDSGAGSKDAGIGKLRGNGFEECPVATGRAAPFPSFPKSARKNICGSGCGK
jgi:hypothetical protein